MYISQEVKHKIHHIIGFAIILAGIFEIFYSVKAYPEIFQIEARLESDSEIKPEQEIKINFTEPMLPDQVVQSVKINPETQFSFHWQNGNKILTIVPAKFWKLQQSYYISISGAKSIMFTKISADLTFETSSYPKVTNFYPAPGEKDIILDIEDPITAVFDKPLENFRVKFIIRPFENLIYQLDSGKRKVELLSQNELQRGQTYEIKVLARYKDAPEEDYREIFRTSFETKPLPPENWEKNLTLRLGQAKRFADPRIAEGKYIDLNLKSQVMTIFENGELLDAYLISSGKRGMPTAQGSFRIENKFPRAWSKKYGLFMPYWMALVPSGDFGIHELPEWPGGFKEGVAHLGTPVSHGCVRLGIGPAERVYNWAEIGTPVVIHE